MNKKNLMYILNSTENQGDEIVFLNKFLNGDSEAFAWIYNKYANELLSYGMSMGFDPDTLKDVIHDVFCRLFVNKTFLDNVNSLKAYLFKSLKNRLINLNKEQSNKEDITYDKLSFSLKSTILDELIKEEERTLLQTKIDKYLESLTNRQREAVYLRFIQELEYDEIAVLLDMTPNAARKLISRAIGRIREQNLLLFLILSLSC